MKPRSMAAATQREGWGLVSLDVRAMQQQASAAAGVGQSLRPCAVLQTINLVAPKGQQLCTITGKRKHYHQHHHHHHHHLALEYIRRARVRVLRVPGMDCLTYMSCSQRRKLFRETKMIGSAKISRWWLFGARRRRAQTHGTRWSLTVR